MILKYTISYLQQLFLAVDFGIIYICLGCVYESTNNQQQ